ncbi:hypothetical protein [Lederbergia lenta]|uniref:hypothetical protein n=1 Tax=Lederbergia lenta TaxID=1467 RepID=UPI00203D97E8|nr:hypothetical protein [Lederbergia lenta]MCM3109998.1 hypothetical protein [Lederbergia lenta]
METLIAVYLEDIETGGQTGFEWFEDEEEANNHLQRVNEDIVKYKKEAVFKAVKRIANYDKQNNRASF